MSNHNRDLEKTNPDKELATQQQLIADLSQQLETNKKEFEAFLFSIGHDLRAPLGHISGFVQLLQVRLEGKLDSKCEDYLKVIFDSTTNMGVMLDAILQLSRLSQAPLDLKLTDVNNIVQDILIERQEETVKRNIEWKINPLPNLIVDRELVKKAMLFLIDNAIKFTKKTNNPYIEIGMITDEPTKEGDATFYIQDNGVGFQDENKTKLFHLFQRLHREEDFTGFGIGLAMCKKIVDMHGGQCWAQGRSDGATFYFSLPNGVKHSSL